MVVPKSCQKVSRKGVLELLESWRCLRVSQSPRLRVFGSSLPAVLPSTLNLFFPSALAGVVSRRLIVSASPRLGVFPPPRPRLILAVPPCQANVSGHFCIFKPYRPQFLARFNTSIWTNVYRRWHGGTACEKQSESMGKTPSVKTTMPACASRAMNSWRCLLRCDCAIAA